MTVVARGVCVLGLIGLLCACAPQRSVRVEPAPGTRRPDAAAIGTDEYVVARGDTLYGIAFRHKLDYRELAARNQIGPPFTIYPGQRLRLGAQVAPAMPVASRPSDSMQRPPRGGGVVSPIVQAPRVGSDSGAANPPAAPVAPTVPEPSPVAVAQPAEPAVSKPSAPPVSQGPLQWRWPAEGPLISKFLSGDPTRQGINLAGGAGDPVRAAANGVVVYSGSGLIGYGELVIIKHDDTWLSAYGHNRKRLVSEGEVVQGGQQVAEMGRSGASRDMLHFEVRKNGKPVDPLTVLPGR